MATEDAVVETENSEVDTDIQTDQVTDDNAPPSEAETPAAEPEGGWPSDWRQRIAGNDAQALKRLERFTKPEDIFTSYRNAEKKLSERAPAKPGDDASDAEIAAWRKANGVPETPDAYELKLEEGFTIGEEDKPIIDDFLAVAHQHNLPADVAKDMVEWYYATQDAQAAERAEADEAAKDAAYSEFRETWGGDFKTNLNIAGNAFAEEPELADMVFSARLADGTLFGNNVKAMDWLVRLARQANPVATVVPNAAGEPGKAINDEIAQLEAEMGDSNSRYWKDPGRQARYRDLIDAREAHQGSR